MYKTFFGPCLWFKKGASNWLFSTANRDGAKIFLLHKYSQEQCIYYYKRRSQCHLLAIENNQFGPYSIYFFIFSAYEKAVILVRDPLDNSFSPSLVFDMKTNFTDLKFPEEFLKPKQYKVWLKTFMKLWQSWHKDVINNFQPNYCVLIYENLKSNLIETLKPCVEFLGFKINEELANCILKNKSGFHIRKPSRPFKEEKEKLLKSIPERDMNWYKKIREEIYKKIQNKATQHLSRNEL